MSTCLFSLKCAPERNKPVYFIPKNVQLLTLTLRKRINEIGKMVKRQGWLRFCCGFAAFMDLILIKLSLGHQSKSAPFKWALLVIWKKSEIGTQMPARQRIVWKLIVIQIVVLLFVCDATLGNNTTPSPNQIPIIFSPFNCNPIQWEKPHRITR